ncbi:Ferrous iron transport protein B [Serratia fonticola]|uniref:Ferrous iron transport protein B n=1 Tax=Serratia fonticola TaxID=47917 RepID=A0A4U9WQ48_SERFO|nr:Ferrous iron transport protein B [Serratia fonticola]
MPPTSICLMNSVPPSIETWQGLKNTFSLSVLSNPIEASKGDGEMGVGSMGVMSSKFGTSISAYSYLIFRVAVRSLRLGDGSHCT